MPILILIFFAVIFRRTIFVAPNSWKFRWIESTCLLEICNSGQGVLLLYRSEDEDEESSWICQVGWVSGELWIPQGRLCLIVADDWALTRRIIKFIRMMIRRRVCKLLPMMITNLGYKNMFPFTFLKKKSYSALNIRGNFFRGTR